MGPLETTERTALRVAERDEIGGRDGLGTKQELDRRGNGAVIEHHQLDDPPGRFVRLDEQAREGLRPVTARNVADATAFAARQTGGVSSQFVRVGAGSNGLTVDLIDVPFARGGVIYCWTGQAFDVDRDLEVVVRHLQCDLLGGIRRGSLDGGRHDLRLDRERRIYRASLDMGQSPSNRWLCRPVPSDRPRSVRDTRPGT